MSGSKKGDVVYEIRADDSYLESDLDNARKKVEESTEKTGERSEQIEKQTSETLKKEKDGVTQHHKQQNEKRNQDDKDSGKNREDTERKTSEKIKSIATGTAKAIGAGILAAGTAAAAVGGLAVKSANEMDQAVGQFIASTGIAKEQTIKLADGTVQVIDNTERYKSVMEDIYKSNYGDSFEDIANAMASVQQQMTYLDDTEMKAVTEAAFTLRDVFGYEVPESVRAANSIVDAFGGSASDAFNLIAQGAQMGLDYSGELLDSINEYAPQFKKLGLDAEDMFQIFASGTNAGAFNLDKIGDAVKELSIRVIDGSDTTKQGFESIGLSADEMAAKFAAGGDSAKEAFRQTIQALGEMEDPLEQNAAGVNLFGTMWEDLGGEVITSLAEINDGIDQTYDMMSDLQDVRYDNLGSMLEELKRSVEMLLVPLGEELIPILTDLIEGVLPVLQEMLPPIMEAVSQIFSQLGPVIEELLPPLLEILEELFPVLMDLANAILPVLADLFSMIAPMLAEIIGELLPVLLSLMGALAPVLDLIWPVLETIIECVMTLISGALVPLLSALMPVYEMLLNRMIPILQILLSVFQEVFEGIVSQVMRHVQNIISVITNLMNFIQNVFTGRWRSAWENIKSIFAAVADSLALTFKTPINTLIDLINGFLKGLNNIQIPDWVPGIGGKEFHIPTIPRLKTGIDFVPGDYFPAYLDYGERVLTQEENARFMALGGLYGMESRISDGIKSTGNSRIVIQVPVNVNGREIARATAEYMGEQQCWEDL